ncbi:DUF2807 domain-containing protein, partial [Roseibium sp. RKSG952]|uniref:GIN domain-containing protein n=1 Tax=Roseibium sp. RKSG952 TaxID=2529384 RepID=UPI0018AD2398
VKSKKLELILSGSSSLIIYGGNLDCQNLLLSDASKYAAAHLNSKKANINVKDAAKANINVMEPAVSHVSGSGKLILNGQLH